MYGNRETLCGIAEDVMDASFSNERSLSVLIVDDCGDGAESLAFLLRHSGHEVRTATHPRQALAAVAEFAPDVLLLDIGLPGMDGYRLAVDLCQRLSDRPLLIAMTGFAGLERRSREEGFDHHLVKPFDTSELFHLLRAHADSLAGAAA
jgi:CheY-like chemotaxis protein